ncbi:MAG: sugar transferase [Desulfovibrio sp.]|uniref:sugar transferase n=1 Tax=Desulfovibrio sp. 7SRBS1 TaxID=3378064 RepID=UPI003B4151BC
MMSMIRKRRLKRMLDIFGALVGLVVLSPVFLLTLLAVWMDDRSPIFYSQTRVGLNGRHFRILKFRSMHRNADEHLGRLAADRSEDITFKMKHDPRVTRVGRIIRKLSIDELPQLYNVLRGEMSLVGPRPALPAEVARYTLAQRRRLEVKPGLTCLWQIKGRSDLNFEQQVAMDVEYISTHSLTTDISILARTFIAVLGGRGAY